jgi:predicted enzyme related to lactoylglutathione lyase
MVIFGDGDEHIGGLQQVEKVIAGNSPSPWFKVPDLEDYKAKAVKFGGTADEPTSPVPGVGFSTVLRDPDGNIVGIVQYTE